MLSFVFKLPQLTLTGGENNNWHVQREVVKTKLYFIFLIILVAALAAIGLFLEANFRFWAWLTGGLVLYIWCKDVFTGKGWFEKGKLVQERKLTPFQKQMANLSYTEFVAALPPLSKTEKEGYIELMKLCVAADKQPELLLFFETLKDFSLDDDYGTHLNYVLEYLDTRNIAFVAALDWKADVEDLIWRLTTSLRDNFEMQISLPTRSDYGDRTSVSFAGVFADFDKPLRTQGLQMGFIDTQSDEYVLFLHRVKEKALVEVAVGKIGYRYYEMGEKS